MKFILILSMWLITLLLLVGRPYDYQYPTDMAKMTKQLLIWDVVNLVSSVIILNKL